MSSTVTTHREWLTHLDVHGAAVLSLASVTCRAGVLVKLWSWEAVRPANLTFVHAVGGCGLAAHGLFATLARSINRYKMSNISNALQQMYYTTWNLSAGYESRVLRLVVDKRVSEVGTSNGWIHDDRALVQVMPGDFMLHLETTNVVPSLKQDGSTAPNLFPDVRFWKGGVTWWILGSPIGIDVSVGHELVPVTTQGITVPSPRRLPGPFFGVLGRLGVP